MGISKKVIKVESNYVNKIYKGTYVPIYNSINNLPPIKCNGEIKGMYNKEDGDSKKKKCEKKILDSIQDIRILISQTMHALNDVEGGINVKSYYKKNPNSNIYKRAKADVKGRLQKINLMTYIRLYGKKKVKNINGKWYLFLNDKYTYNITDSKLTIKGKNKNVAVGVDFMLPSNHGSLSDMNTVTAFMASFETKGKKGKKTTKTVISNAIVIRPHNANVDGNYVAHTTKFMNEFAKTNRSKCTNTIMGGSKYGAKSIEIAADNSSKAKGTKRNLYDRVICTNNAAIVTGINSREGLKKQISKDQLKNLDGVDLYFISAANDPNMHKNKNDNWDDSKSSITNSYLGSGIKTILKNCPNSQVYLISNSPRKRELSGLSSSNRYHYSPDYWDKCGINQKHTEHGYGAILDETLAGSLISNNGKIS